MILAKSEHWRSVQESPIVTAFGLLNSTHLLHQAK